MRVKAIAAGHVGAPITVDRKVSRGKQGDEVVQVPADYILPGDEFEWEGELGNWMKPVDEETGPSKKEIMAQLDAAGISYFKGATAEKLQALLPKE